jgi:hypothetical protein
MSPIIVNSEEYNSIEKCAGMKGSPFCDDILRRVGEIICRHNVEDSFGALFVHRHFDMPSGSLAVQSSLSDDIEIIQFLDESKVAVEDLHGVSFMLPTESGAFRAFELSVPYGDQPDAEIPAPFQKELAEFIRNNHLERTLGYFRRGKMDFTGEELNIQELKTSFLIPKAELPEAVLRDRTPAKWVFAAGQDRNVPIQMQLCSNTEGKGSDKVNMSIVDGVLRKRGLTMSS